VLRIVRAVVTCPKGESILPEHKAQLIEKLTGVYTSKRTYYAELKDKIAELSKRNFQLEVINDLAQEFNISLPRDYLDKTVKTIHERVQEVFYVKNLAIFALKKDRLQVSFCYPPDDNCYKGLEVPPDQGAALWKAVSGTQQVIWQEGAGPEDHFLARQGLDVAVINPLVTPNRTYGLFVVGSDRSTPYDPLDLAFFQQLANQIAIYLQDGALFAEVNRAKSEWESTFKAVRDIIVVLDRQLCILRVNQAAVEFCGLGESEILGKRYCDLFCTSKDRCAECNYKEALATGETSNIQRRLKDGRVMEIFVYPAVQENNNPGAVIYIKDISERLKMQVQLLQTARLAALGEMAAGVAHELNTPLAVIIGDAELLLRTVPEDDQRYKILQDIKTCGLRCKRIVRGLLTFSRQEQYVFQPVNLNAVVDEAVKLVSYHIETENIELHLEQDEQLPVVEGNSQQLEQVVVNLLLNARQSFDADDDRQHRITVRTGFNKDRNQAFIKVSDNGRGIPQKILTKIFDPFFTSKGVGKGTGLGLSVSLGIVQKHGGTIAVESERGKGSIFKVYLPPARINGDKLNNGKE
jgi:two-component system NtrC family sensor kinase